MDIVARLKSLFDSGPVELPSVRKLSGGTEDALAASIDGLLPGERAWIMFEEGRALFSAMDDQYAFGELDEPGKLNLGAFAVTTAPNLILDRSRGASISLDGQIRSPLSLPKPLHRRTVQPVRKKEPRQSRA
jgi:hypothetical protein